MPEITAAMVMKLREQTGAAMMLCKEALKETDGDFENATVYIRKKLGGKLSASEGRSASEGVVAVVVVDSQDAAIVELNSETDFVAKSADFKGLAREIAEQVARQKGHSVETVLTQDSLAQPGTTLQARLEDVYTKLREKIVFKRFEFISTDCQRGAGRLCPCARQRQDRGAGRTRSRLPGGRRERGRAEPGAGAGDAGRRDPTRYLNREEVSERTLEQERDIARTTARNEGKPEAAVEKVVEGRVRKFYEETVLVDQAWLREPKKTVTQVLKEAGLTLRRYVRYSVGEQTTGAESSGAIKETVE